MIKKRISSSAFENSRFPSPTSRETPSLGLEWDWEICMFNTLPSDSDSMVYRLHERNHGTRSHAQIWWNMPPIKLLPISQTLLLLFGRKPDSWESESLCPGTALSPIGCFPMSTWQRASIENCPECGALGKGIGSCRHFFNNALENTCVLLGNENVKSKLWSPLWIKCIQKII